MGPAVRIGGALAAVRELYACWARADVQRMEALVTDDFLWVEHPAAPDAGTHRGRAAWEKSRRAYEEVWERIVITPLRHLVSAPNVLAVVHYDLVAHGGVPITATTGHLIALRGEAIASLRMLDRADSLAALGPDALTLDANARAVASTCELRESAAQGDRVAGAVLDPASGEETGGLWTIRRGEILTATALPTYDDALARL